MRGSPLNESFTEIRDKLYKYLSLNKPPITCKKYQVPTLLQQIL